MDALVPALVAAALAELGDKTPWLAAILAARFGVRVVLLGALAGTAAGAAISAALGATLQPLMIAEARLLFLGVALAVTGLAALLPLKAPDPLAGWRIGGFATAAAGIFILQFGEGTQFLVLALAANAKVPALAALGAVLGSMAVIVPLTIAGVALRDRLPVRAMRLVPAALFLVAGVIAAINALRLV